MYFLFLLLKRQDENEPVIYFKNKQGKLWRLMGWVKYLWEYKGWRSESKRTTCKKLLF